MTIQQIIDLSISKGYKVEIKYQNYQHESSTRIISNINYSDEFDEKGYHNEHIKAFCHLRNEERSFKISRISNIRILSPNAENNSWLIANQPTPTQNIPNADSSNKSGSCYIATMAYGNYDHPQVLLLRKYRDQVLLKNVIGKLSVRVYYFISPRLVKHLKNKIMINSIIRNILDQFIKHLKN